MNRNRVGDRCCFKLHYTEKDWRYGTLRLWSTDHTEYESGPGLFPVGVIEDQVSNKCYSIPVNQISFSDKVRTEDDLHSSKPYTV